MFKILASTIMGILGGYYMYRGKKTQNMKMVLGGAVLIVLSYVVFSGSGDDKAAKDVLKSMVPSEPGQLPALPTPNQ